MFPPYGAVKPCCKLFPEINRSSQGKPHPFWGVPPLSKKTHPHAIHGTAFGIALARCCRARSRSWGSTRRWTPWTPPPECPGCPKSHSIGGGWRRPVFGGWFKGESRRKPREGWFKGKGKWVGLKGWFKGEGVVTFILTQTKWPHGWSQVVPLVFDTHGWVGGARQSARMLLSEVAAAIAGEIVPTVATPPLCSLKELSKEFLF